MNTDVKTFNEVPPANRPNEYYQHWIVVEFVEGTPNDEVDTQEKYEDAALIEVFGDLMPKDLLVVWQDDTHLTLKYNIGVSVPTKLGVFVSSAIVKPPVPYQERIWTLAMQDALQLQDMMPRELADWLMHFNGYPTQDRRADIEACEREMFIDYDDVVDGMHWDYIVWLWDYEQDKFVGHGFVDQDVAYVFWCKHYNDVREKLGIITTKSSDDDIKWAREYWGALSDVESYDFYHVAICGGSHWNGVDVNTTYRDYLVYSARQSDYEKRMDI